MRTSPIVLAYLHDPVGLATAARTVSDLSHPEPDAGDACVLWCLAIRHAVLHGEFDVRVGMSWLDDERRSRWVERIEEAEARPAVEFDHNGWVVHAFQAAWSAIVHTDVPEGPELLAAAHLRLALENAVRVGNDTDTVAAIAGQLLGARWGARAVPAAWRDVVFGWPGITGENLVIRVLALV
jgi:ADP-ribosylglycohydrolase